jgi:surface carbohydrate biosynthesis protein
MILFSKEKVLLFPVETTVRELDYRLILAVLCAKPGWRILLGEHEEIFKISIHIRNAIQVLKNVTGGKRPWKYARYKQLGQRIICLDEEGGIYGGNEESWRSLLDNRLDVRSLDSDDYVCTWGVFQANHYLSLKPACSPNIKATGHPRFDLGKPEFREIFRKESELLLGQYGNFFLINTSFHSNNISGPDVLLNHFKVSPESVGERSRRIEHYVHDKQLLARTIGLINHLSNAFPSHKIIVRPHPSEDSRTYKTMLRHIPRTFVLREGSLHAWLLAAKVLIHGGCTTAIEAHQCGTPIINFRPLSDPRFEVGLPNLLGVSCSSYEDVEHTLETILSGSNFPHVEEDKSLPLRDVLANFGSGSNAFQSLAKLIDHCQSETVAESQSDGFRGTISLLMQYINHKLFSILPKLKQRLLNRPRGTEKFPHLNRSEIINKVQTISGMVGRNVKLNFIGTRLLSIRPDEKLL